jgi:predicted outer membrane repeat protein
MRNENYSSPTLTNCTFTSNNASSYGGGMYNSGSSPTLIGCTFTGNTANDGGGMYNVGSTTILGGCVFENNAATDSGGAIYSISDSDMVLENCTIIGNTALLGGGLFCDQFTNADMTSCIIELNDAQNGGGGMYNNYYSNSTLTNCKLRNNTTVSIGGAIYNVESNTVISDSIVCGNGETPFVGEWTDNGGNTISDECSPDCPDINGDGYIDVSDLLIVIAYWGQANSPADLNEDGIVDVSDLLIVIGNWGPCE